MSRTYTSRDVWLEHRGELKTLAQEAQQSQRTIVRHFGGEGGKFYGAATPTADVPHVRIEWIGPSQSGGEIVVSAQDLERVTARQASAA